MLVSMTGFGQGEASDDFAIVTSEIRTVNHRFADFSIKLPRGLQHREREVKELVRGSVTRGRIYVTVSVDQAEGVQTATMNEPLMQEYLTKLREFAKRNGLSGDVDINTLVSLPDVFSNHNGAVSDDDIWPLVQASLKTAAESCREMRTIEGKALHKDMLARVATIATVVDAIDTYAPSASEKHAKQFRARIEKLMDTSKLDEDRLLTEISLMAERLDFTEEIIRLRSHIAQFNDCLKAGGEVSKKLTYLLQEMHREASTIGSKASDSEVIQRVVALKEETEKIREQVQNVE